MPNLYATLFVSLVSCSALSFLILALVLHKGQLCRGQSARIQRQLATLVSFISLAGLSGFESQQNPYLVALVFASALVGWFLCYRLNKLKQKRSLSLKSWWIMAIPLLLAALWLIIQHSLWLFSFLACGAAIAHWLLVKAKHRLSSFDRLLPLIGLAAAMLSLILVCGYLMLNPALFEQTATVKQFVIMSVSLLAATLLWLSPQFYQTAPPAALLLAVAFMSLISNISLQAIHL
ncbi:hypothetical protein [Agarivorans gilvus]|jgi:hypothetical protein|uniref:Uncharacterized protein n=1 Tax=Agarivorans gilvus TaxID=680279 RepID=A0ABQ1I3Q4_9ALTE|nr:hypothetical protein [Agarivorans gilvus]GGB09315.1 hypothetical protein GCM10007414_23390 [Agarivorans gilvus]